MVRELTSEERAARQDALLSYVQEKLPGIRAQSYHSASWLDFLFWPVYENYLAKVIFPYLIWQLDQWNGLGHLVMWREVDRMTDKECGVFIRVYWGLRTTDPVLFNHWPKDEVICWATPEERKGLRETALMYPLQWKNFNGIILEPTTE